MGVRTGTLGTLHSSVTAVVSTAPHTINNQIITRLEMEFFSFVPPSLLAMSTCIAMVAAMPQTAVPDTPADVSRLESNPAPASFSRALPSQPSSAPAPRAGNPQTSSRFLPPGLFQAPVTNQNQGLQNTLAAGGLGAVGAVAAGGCLFGGNCDLSFRPSLGASLDANGQIVPQLGITTQVGNGQGVGTTFTGGLQLDGTSDNGIGGFVAGGVNNGDPNSISPGLQTGFGFSGQNGQTVATAQLGGNVQAPQVAGVNFNRPNNAFGVQPTVLGQAAPNLNLFNLFNQQNQRPPQFFGR